MVFLGSEIKTDLLDSPPPPQVFPDFLYHLFTKNLCTHRMLDMPVYRDEYFVAQGAIDVVRESFG